MPIIFDVCSERIVKNGFSFCFFVLQIKMILWIFVANFFVCALCQTTEPSQTDLTSLLETLFTPVPETNTTSDAISNETTNVITNVINDVTTDSGETENRLSESNVSCVVSIAMNDANVLKSLIFKKNLKSR